MRGHRTGAEGECPPWRRAAGELANQRPVRQLIAVAAAGRVNWKVPVGQRMQGVDDLVQRCRLLLPCETAGEDGAQLVPRRGWHARCKAAVCNDFHGMVGDIEIKQHAAVGFRIPDVEFTEDMLGTLTRRDAAPYLRKRQAAFDDDAQLALVAMFARLDGVLDPVKLGIGKERPDMGVRGAQVGAQALEA